MPDRDKGQIMMPVPDEQALIQFQIEALQRINDNLRALNDGQNETVKAMKEVRDDLRHIDVRLTRIETQRDMSSGMARWFFPNAQAVLMLVGFIILVVVILQANEKL